MTTYFNNLNIKISNKKDIQPAELEDKSFYKMFSPEAFTLRPRDDIYFNLKFKIDAPTQIKPWINLLPSLKQFDLRIENQDWCSNKIKDETIHLHIIQTFYKNNLYLKEANNCLYIFHLVEKQMIKFKYTVIT